MSVEPEHSSAQPASSLEPPSRKWVWCSSDESIARGQISVLAVLEVPCAVALFWWITTISPWPWFTVVGLMAAPMLLLRSPASIAAGKASFQAYSNSGNLLARTQLVVIAGFAAMASGSICFTWAPDFLTGLGGWSSFLGCVVVGVLAVVVVRAIVIAGLGLVLGTKLARFNVAEVEIAVKIAAAVAVTIAVVDFDMVRGAATVAGAIVGNSALVHAKEVQALLFALLPLVGMVSRITLMRFCATLHHFSEGLDEYAKNWWETVLTIDLLHPPVLLPGAGPVFGGLPVAQLWRMSLPSGSVVERVLNAVIKVGLIFLIYVPALLYRWNIKASSWLWGPVAFVLRPVVWVNDEAMRSKTAFWTTWVLQSAIGSGVLALAAWLSMSFLPADLARESPRWLQSVQARWPAPDLGLRYGLLWCVVLLMAALLFAAYRMRAAHAKALEGAGDFHKGYDPELKAEFTRLAQPVRRLLRWNLAMIALAIWMFALWWSLERWPAELNGVLWGWLKPLL